MGRRRAASVRLERAALNARTGDLLTTSDIPGHAMKATDATKSQGAILGKAMEDFTGESGLIMILAALQ